MRHGQRGKTSRGLVSARIEEARSTAQDKREELGFSRELPENVEYEAARRAVRAARKKRRDDHA